MNNQTQGPLIPGSKSFSTEEITLLVSNDIMTDKFTDGVLVISNNKISNMNDPINDNDGANLNFLINSKVIPRGDNNTIQYNDNNEFNGVNDLRYENNQLIFDELTNGVVSFSEGTISGLGLPTDKKESASKEYVDSKLNLTESVINANVNNLVYPAEQMYNGIIYRDPVINSTINTKFDITASAESLIELYPEKIVGLTALFYLKNITSNDDIYIYLLPGTGVTFNNNTQEGTTIPKGCILKSTIIITSLTTVMIYIESITDVSLNFLESNSKYMTSMTSIPYSLNILVSNELMIKNGMYKTYYDESNTESTSLQISWSSIFFGQLSRYNLSSDIYINLPSPAYLFILLAKYSGVYPYIIRNGDYNYSITLTGSSGWVLDPNASFTILPRQSALLWFYINNGTILIYMIGKMNI